MSVSCTRMRPPPSRLRSSRHVDWDLVAFRQVEVQGLGDHPKAAIERRLKAEQPQGEVTLYGPEPCNAHKGLQRRATNYSSPIRIYERMRRAKSGIFTTSRITPKVIAAINSQATTARDSGAMAIP